MIRKVSIGEEEVFDIRTIISMQAPAGRRAKGAMMWMGIVMMVMMVAIRKVHGVVMNWSLMGNLWKSQGRPSRAIPGVFPIHMCS